MPMFSSNMLSQIIRFYGHAMQGIMGSYLEKNIQAFMEIQQRMAEQSKGPVRKPIRPRGLDPVHERAGRPCCRT